MNEYEHPLVNDDGKIICQLCGKPFLTISPKHLINHKVTYSEYKLRFPNAPLTSAEFDSRSKYGKINKEEKIFKDQEIEPESKNFMGDETFVNEEPEVEEEIDLQRVIDSEKRDPVRDSKYKILDHLKMYLTNIKMDYPIREDLPDGRTMFEFITDFADPVLKIDFEFPGMFWHNRDQFVDLNRNMKLKQCGWKIIEIKSNSPTFDEIENSLKSL